jgi:hypothetical protein
LTGSASSPSEIVEKAAALAADPPRLAEIKAALCGDVRASPMLGERDFARRRGGLRHDFAALARRPVARRLDHRAIVAAADSAAAPGHSGEGAQAPRATQSASASPIANHLPVRSANGGMARVSQAPGFILAAPDAAASPVAMEVRTATAQRERGRNRR